MGEGVSLVVLIVAGVGMEEEGGDGLEMKGKARNIFAAKPTAFANQFLFQQHTDTTAKDPLLRSHCPHHLE